MELDEKKGYLDEEMGVGLVAKRPLDKARTVLESEADADPFEAFPLAAEFILAQTSETGI